MKILIIDDDAVRVPVISKYCEKVGIIGTVEHSAVIPDNDFVFHEYDVIFLDHDLGTGGDMSRLLRDRIGIWANVDTFEPQPLVIIHSMNPIGAASIQRTLMEDYFFHRRNVEVMPFGRIWEEVHGNR